MKRLFLPILSTLILAACAPYARYSTTGTNSPREVIPDNDQPTTNDYLRFGSIVQQYIGRPYAGRSRYEPGLDCSLFTQEVMRDYAHKDIGRTAEDQFERGVDLPRNRLRPGDLVFFQTERARISHVGIYVGYNSFVHASSSQGIIISNLSEEYWAKRYIGAKRVINLPQSKIDRKDSDKGSDKKDEGYEKYKRSHERK